jgi:O-Antigen ligase
MTASISSRLKAFSPFGRRAARARPLPKLGAYAGAGVLQRNRKKILVGTFLFIILYTMAFQLFGRFMVVQFMAPLAVIAALIIWALPEVGRAPTGLLQKLFFAFILALLCWPDYLAIALPGMPWVTAIRLVGFPLALILLISLSVSVEFRRELQGVISAVPVIWKMLFTFAIIAFLSIAVSADKAQSVNKFVVGMLYWVSIFFVACFVFTKEGNAHRFSYIIWGIVLFLCLIGVQEWRQSSIVWAGHIPSFLKVEDESVQRILASGGRAATGLYRVQTKFTTPLGFAEFLALSAPFVLHIAMTARQWWHRVLAGITFPLIFWTIVNTDSRLGAVGFFMTFLLYMLVWSSLRWYRNRDSLFGPAITLAYPAVLAAFIAATFAVGRLRAMVWGTGAQSFSTQAREDQLAMAIPKVIRAPWGHGIGQGADSLGYTNLAGVLTIDSYYISVAMEFGVIGFLLYFGMLLVGVVQSGRYMLVAKGRDEMILAPAAIALLNFFVIKSVFSQQENHPLVFAILGMSVALIWRVKQTLPPKVNDGRLPPAGYVPRQSRLVEDW